MPIVDENQSERDKSPRGSDEIRMILFTGDLWEHVCPTIRIIKPALEAGVEVLKGSEWIEGSLQIYPERIRQADIIVIQRDFPKYEAEFEEIILEVNRLGKPLVYDLDDLLFELPEIHPDTAQYRGGRISMLRSVLEAQAVTVASPFLKSYLQKFNANAWVLPNYLIDEYWTLREPKRDHSTLDERPIVLGYMGGHSHVPDLEMLIPTLLRLKDRYQEKISLIFWGVEPPPELTGIENTEVFIPGLAEYQSFAEYFSAQNCDIFIAPLRDSIFNRCKSSLKFLEYSALGVPGVYQKIEPYIDIVKHGKNGLLADSEEEWEENLTLLIEDPDLRYQLAYAAHETLKSEWLLSEKSGDWWAIFDQAISTKSVSNHSSIAVLQKTHEWLLDSQNKSSAIQKEMEERDQDLVNAHVQFEKLESNLQERTNEIQSLNTQISQYKEEVDLLQKKIVETEDTIAHRDATIEKQRRTLKEGENRIQLVEDELRTTNAHLAGILSSTGWQLLEVLYRIRLRLIPSGGIRERLMIGIIKTVHYWRKYGFRRLLSRITRRPVTKAENGVDDHLIQIPPVHVSIRYQVEEEIETLPSDVSLIILSDLYSSDFRERAELWVRNQTVQDVELVSWSQEKTEAQILSDKLVTLKASNLPELIQKLHCEFICIADADLLSQNATYLEANLIALASETLQFTVNANGNAQWLKQLIERAEFPGSAENPFRRMVIRRSCLESSGVLDLSAILSSNKPRLVGKIITHTTNFKDASEDFPTSTSIPDVEMQVIGSEIVARWSGQTGWGQVDHFTFPVDLALRLNKLESDLDTVLVLLPFMAVGGAERLLLHIMQNLTDRLRFVVLTVEGYDTRLGTMADEFRSITPYVYTAMDYTPPHLMFSLLSYLIDRFEPRSLYIANGANWIYDAVSTIKREFPFLYVIDQVYHHQLGWISRYDPAIVAAIDAHIGGNSKVCQAYISKGAKTHQVYLIEHGIVSEDLDLSDYPEERRWKLRKNLDLPKVGKIISFIARMHPQKRPIDFIELARRFNKNPDINFLMVGDGPLADVVDEQIEKTGLLNIRRKPFYSPISDIYAISDVVVLPSEYEATPLVLLEAQAMGKPVVVTDVGNNRDIIEMTNGGYVVDKVGDVHSLYDGVRKAIDMPIDGTAVRRAIVDRFDMSIIAEQYFHVLKGE